jgi:deoxyribonucleoside regulator
VAWGRTLQKVAEALPLRVEPPQDIEVVQVLGGVSQLSSAYNGDEVCKRIANAFSAPCHLLYAPAIADRAESKRIIMSQAGVRQTTQYYDRLTVALAGLGSVELTEDNMEYRLGYFTEAEFRKLKGQAAVGDHCVFFDINGKICGERINAKRVGIDYRQLMKIPRRITAATGPLKPKVIIGAARAGLFNELVTDETTAQEVLRLIPERV